MVDSELTVKNIEQAIANLSTYPLRKNIEEVQGGTGNEAHRILPMIWPLIQELVLLADACEAGMLVPTSKDKNV